MSHGMQFDRFGDDQTAMAWLEGNVWPDGRVCPRCGSDHTCVARHPDMPYHCSRCRKYFSVRTCTVMEHSKIGYRKWATAVCLVATHPEGISSAQLGRDLGIRQGSAWLLLRRLREWGTLAGHDLAAGQAE